MANRSYLYSSNLIPNTNVLKSERRLVGLSEWPNNIPLIYRVLMSGNPRVCTTSIWDNDEDIAIVSDYAPGLERLKQFLKRINLPQAQPYIDEALAFLEHKDNAQDYLVLECGEIFNFNDEPMEDQNKALLKDIQDLEHEMTIALEDLHILANPASEILSSMGKLAKLFRKKPAPLTPIAPADLQEQENKLLTAIFQLGLGEWNNLLYYDFSNDGEDGKTADL
jgi:hypothetical protein